MKYSGKFIARNLKILCKDHIKDLTFSHTHLPADDWLLIDRTRTYQHTCKNTLHVNQKSVTLMSRASTSRDNIQVNLIQRANWSNNNNVSQPLRIVSIDSDYHLQSSNIRKIFFALLFYYEIIKIIQLQIFDCMIIKIIHTNFLVFFLLKLQGKKKFLLHRILNINRGKF